MASFQDHCADCEAALGERFEEINLWLDELFITYGSGHRPIRHNAAAIERIRTKHGDKAAEAAKIHILRDCGAVPTVEEAEQSCFYQKRVFDRFVQENGTY